MLYYYFFLFFLSFDAIHLHRVVNIWVLLARVSHFNVFCGWDTVHRVFSGWCHLRRLVCMLISETLCLFLPSHKLEFISLIFTILVISRIFPNISAAQLFSEYLQSIQHQNSQIFSLGKCKLFQPQTMRGFQVLNILSKFTSTAGERTENFNCFQKKAVAQCIPWLYFNFTISKKNHAKWSGKKQPFWFCFFFKGNSKEYNMPVQTKVKFIDGLNITANTSCQSFKINKRLERQALFSLMWLL